MKSKRNPLKTSQQQAQRIATEKYKSELASRFKEGMGSLVQQSRLHAHAKAEIRVWKANLDRLEIDLNKAIGLNDTTRAEKLRGKIALARENLAEVTIFEASVRKLLETRLAEPL